MYMLTRQAPNEIIHISAILSNQVNIEALFPMLSEGRNPIGFLTWRSAREAILTLVDNNNGAVGQIPPLINIGERRPAFER